MTTNQELENVIDALSRTITELRGMKAKLAESEARNVSNLEIKKNLALRINELQKELTALSNRADQSEANYQWVLKRLAEDRLDYKVPIAPLSMYLRPFPIRHVTSSFRLGVNAWEMAFIVPEECADQNYRDRFKDMLACEFGRQYGEAIRKQVLTGLKGV